MGQSKLYGQTQTQRVEKCIAPMKRPWQDHECRSEEQGLMILSTVGRHGKSEMQEKEVKSLAASEPKRTETQGEGGAGGQFLGRVASKVRGTQIWGLFDSNTPCLPRKVLMNGGKTECAGGSLMVLTVKVRGQAYGLKFF